MDTTMTTQDHRIDQTSYLLLGLLLVLLTVSFFQAWYWCSESWVRFGLEGNAGYSPGPLIPVLVFLMLSARLRRFPPTPQIAHQDVFHKAYMRLLHPIVVRVVGLWNQLRGVKSEGEELEKAAYGKRSLGVWAAWIALAALTTASLYYGRHAGYGMTYEILRPIGFVLLFVNIVIFGAAFTYVAWRRLHTDDKALTASRSPVNVAVGAFLLTLSLLIHFSAIRGAMPQLSIIAFMASLGSLIWLFYGWRVARFFIFPLAFMVLALPMDWVEAKFGLPAQVFATKHSVAIMEFIGLKIQMVGKTTFNVIKGGEPIEFNIAAPCSGLKSFVALTAISATYGYVTQKTTAKILIIMACGPILAIITNIIRLVVVGATAQTINRAWAMWVHDHALPIYILAILFLMLIDKLVNAKWLRIEDF